MKRKAYAIVVKDILTREVNMSDIGQRMKQRRKLAGMSQTDLGKIVGVSKVAVSQWENGDTQPNGENLLKMAQGVKLPARVDFNW